MTYDIFISYRRKGGYETAKHLYDLLIRDGYTVSFDIDTLRNGDFDTALLKRIEECSDFILILNEGAFDRTLDPKFNPNNDWMRNELAHALKHNKNIIPVMLEGFTAFPDNLPADISKVVRKNGPKYDSYYFDDFYRRMKQQFFETPEPQIAGGTQTARPTSVVKIKCNHLFDLYIDEEYNERVEEDVLHQVHLPDGEYIFKFLSPVDGEIDKVCKTVRVEGSDIVLDIDLQSVVQARADKEEVAIKKLKQKYNPNRCYEFFCGLCGVELNGLIGFVNSDLEEVIPFVYEEYEPFQAFSLTAAVKRYGKWGTIDQKGKVCVPIEYDELKAEAQLDFPGSGDYIRAVKSGRCGVIDVSGKVVLDFEYDAVSEIIDGLAITSVDKKVALNDLNNHKTILPMEYDNIIATKEYAIFYKGDKCGIMLMDGTLFTEPIYESIKYFCEELCAVKQNGQWGYMDKSGKVCIACAYDECFCFSSGMAAVCKDGKWGFINHGGKLSVPAKFDEVTPMLGGVAVVKSGESCGLLDRAGQFVFPLTKKALILHDVCAHSRPEQARPKCLITPDGTHFIIDKYGNLHNAKLEGEDDGSTYFFVRFDGEELGFAHHQEMEDISFYGSMISYGDEDLLGNFGAIVSKDYDNISSDVDSSTDSDDSDVFRSIVAARKDIDVSEVKYSSMLRKDLGYDDDDYTELMMAVEEEFGVFVDETYFNCLETLAELVNYVHKLQDEDSEEMIPELDLEPEPEPVVKGPRLKRGDLYTIDGVEGIVLEFNDETGEGKLVSKRRIANTWEDPTFAGFAKMISAKAKPTPITSFAYQDGRSCCYEIRKTKDWDWKYPSVWWCVYLDEGTGMWYLPSSAEFDSNFFSEEVQRHYEPLTGHYDVNDLNRNPAYWTSNTPSEGHDKAFAAMKSGGFAASRYSKYILVAMRHFKI